MMYNGEAIDLLTRSTIWFGPDHVFFLDLFGFFVNSWVCGVLSNNNLVVIRLDEASLELAAEVEEGGPHPLEMRLLIDKAHRPLIQITGLANVIGQLLYHLTVIRTECLLEAAGSLDNEELLRGLLGGCVVVTVVTTHGDKLLLIAQVSEALESVEFPDEGVSTCLCASRMQQLVTDHLGEVPCTLTWDI